jgi:peptide/nickel transport system permease protein
VLRLLAGRLSVFVPTLLLASVLVFGLTYLVPGDPAILIAGEYATPERIAQIRADLGLDEPFLSRFGSWLGAVVQGDFGTSLFTGEAVDDAVARALPATLQLVGLSLVIAVLFGGFFGLVASLPRRAGVRQVADTISSIAVAVPNFWLGMILMSIFALSLGWFPATGYTSIWDDPVRGLQQTLLPALALGLAGGAEIAKQLSASTRSVLREDFVRTGRSKGMGATALVVRDVLPSASIPPLTTFGVLAARTVGATVAVEVVFGIPGLGSLIVKAATERDIPILQGVVLILAVVVLLTNLAVDLAYRALDPRIRL